MNDTDLTTPRAGLEARAMLCLPPAEPVLEALPARILEHPLLCDLSGPLPALYRHQATALEHLHAGQPVVLTTGVSSGRRTLGLLACLEVAVAQGGAALIIAPTEGVVQEEIARLEELIAATLCGRWGLVSIAELTEAGCLLPRHRGAGEGAVDILVGTPAGVAAGLLGGGQGGWARLFLAQLRALVVERLHELPARDGQVLALTLSAVRAHLAEDGVGWGSPGARGRAFVRLLTSSAPRTNLDEQLGAVFGHETSFVSIAESGAGAAELRVEQVDISLVEGLDAAPLEEVADALALEGPVVALRSAGVQAAGGMHDGALALPAGPGSPGRSGGRVPVVASASALPLDGPASRKRLRTLFVLDEAASLPEVLHETRHLGEGSLRVVLVERGGEPRSAAPRIAPVSREPDAALVETFALLTGSEAGEVSLEATARRLGGMPRRAAARLARAHGRSSRCPLPLPGLPRAVLAIGELQSQAAAGALAGGARRADTRPILLEGSRELIGRLDPDDERALLLDPRSPIPFLCRGRWVQCSRSDGERGEVLVVPALPPRGVRLVRRVDLARLRVIAAAPLHAQEGLFECATWTFAMEERLERAEVTLSDGTIRRIPSRGELARTLEGRGIVLTLPEETAAARGIVIDGQDLEPLGERLCDALRTLVAMPPGALGVLGLPGPQERSLAGRALPTSGPGILLFERSPCSAGVIDRIALGGASLLRKAARAAAGGGGIVGEVAALVAGTGVTEGDPREAAPG